MFTESLDTAEKQNPSLTCAVLLANLSLFSEETFSHVETMREKETERLAQVCYIYIYII